MPVMFHRFVCVAALSLLTNVVGLHAQEVQINESPEVGAIVKSWTSANRLGAGISGWRVQIMAGTDRIEVEAGRNKFRQQYPEVPAVVSHENPYYRLRVGAFRSKAEAAAFITGLQEYPGAYPAKDPKIHPKDFLK